MEMRVEKILEQLKAACTNILSANLTGIYLHGSLALGCFNWDKSDIDFIVVTRTAPTQMEKEKLIKDLLKIDRISPPKGLEMSIVLEKYCRNFTYPTQFELHFSNAHKQSCCDDVSGYCARMNGTDQDLAAHFTIIRKAGITLYGEAADTLFGDVPKADYLDSLKSDVKNAVEEIGENPVYLILNLCSVCAYSKEGAILSKQQGAHWGLKNLPSRYASLIRSAEDSYSNAEESYGSAEPFSADGGIELLEDFARSMVTEIFGQ